MTHEAPQKATPKQTAATNRGLNLIREIFIVIIGVLVALAADDWQENKERDQRDAQVMNMVLAELKNNLQHIKAVGDYHQTMYAGINKSIDKLTEENVFELPEGWQDTQEITTINAAFQLALLSGTLSRIDAELAVSLSRLYDDLNGFDERRSQLALSTLQTSFRDGTRFLTLRRVALGDELAYIETMQPQFEQAIKDIQRDLDL